MTTVPRLPIHLAKKSRSRLMRSIAQLPFIPTGFMSSFWTTVGHTVYTPTIYDADVDWGRQSWVSRHKQVLDHEGVHVAQVERWGHIVHTLLYLGPSPFIAVLAVLALPASIIWLWWLSIALIGLALALAPLSLGFAWGRWRIEREAYMTQIRAAHSRADAIIAARRIAETLWDNYAWAWPRTWAWRWFVKQIDGEGR